MSSKIVQSEAGGPEVLELLEVDESSVAELVANLAADEVLVRVSAASVNPVDAKTRRGAGMLNRTVALPLVPTVGQVFDLADAAAAHRAIEAGHTTGKIVLRMSAVESTAD